MNEWVVPVVGIAAMLVSALVGSPLTAAVLRLAARSGDAGSAGPDPRATGRPTGPDPRATGRPTGPDPAGAGLPSAPDPAASGLVSAPDPAASGLPSAPDPAASGLVSAPDPAAEAVTPTTVAVPGSAVTPSSGGDPPGRPDVPPANDGPTGERALDALRGGTWIGILERLAVTGCLLAGYPSGIAFVIAVKGLGRYPELKENPGASERFVIGTLASMLWAVAVGVLAGRLV